ncbi:DUF485 domain-containing protein [Streptomyces indicus]|uniref:Uncharacterized membrane protein, DUF485 family n=1 Tax=Streptomyces indicus TaxID=417292 RepID=A0A1G9GVG7_9ACTN|nr:DUF485 domain-containing protein [Streptomyces indicus]SDL04671.1 Uncharacterized membrane protein, DUF485 family [Streptomyces indicus]
MHEPPPWARPPGDPHDAHESQDPQAPHDAHDPHDPYESPTPQAPYDPHNPHLTYPWQPPPAPPPPRRRPAPRLGQHGDLRKVRRAYKRLRRVAALTALGSFTLFLMLSAYAPSLTGRQISGGLNLGLLLLLAQLPVTYLAIALYARHAARRVDPLAERLRRAAELEGRL